MESFRVAVAQDSTRSRDPAASNWHEDDEYRACAVETSGIERCEEVRLGELCLDRDGRLVGVAGLLVRLSELETALFDALLRGGGRVVTMDELLADIWPGETMELLRGRLYALIFGLRRKLEGNPLDLKIETARNGYRLWADRRSYSANNG